MLDKLNELAESQAPLHIGIVGCSAEGAALCYRTICTEGAAQTLDSTRLLARAALRHAVAAAGGRAPDA